MITLGTLATLLIDHNLSGPGRSHAQAAKQHGHQHDEPLTSLVTSSIITRCYMSCIDFCHVCMIVLEMNILLLLLHMYSDIQGLYSLSGWTSRKVSKSWGFPIALKIDRHIGSSAAKLSVKFQSDTIIMNPISRLRDFARSYDKTSVRLMNRGPGLIDNDYTSGYIVVYPAFWWSTIHGRSYGQWYTANGDFLGEKTN